MKQQGIALIQVIFIIALLASLVSFIQLDERRAIDRTFQKLAQNQAHEYLLSGESIAIQGLWADRNQNSMDHSDEEWTQLFGPLPLDAGLEGKTFPGNIIIQISDLDGLFNLNWLQKESGQPDEFRKGFERLLFDKGVEIRIANNLKEWFDEASSASYSYMNLDPAYHPSLRRMTDVSELRRIEMVTAAIYEKVRLSLSALPAISSANINFATAEVLQAIAPTLTQNSATAIVDFRKDNPYRDVNDMLNRVKLSKAELQGFPVARLSVQSEYFKIESLVELDGNNYYLTSLVNRSKDNKIRVLSRSFIPFIPKEIE